MAAALHVRRAAIQDDYVRMLQAVRALDDSVGTVLDSLRGRARNTLVFYLSDNGFLYGEHRRWDKGTPYEESVRVPFVVRWPPSFRRRHAFTSSALVENIDIAPTIAAAAGVDWRRMARR